MDSKPIANNDMYVPPIIATSGLIISMFWGFLIQDRESEEYVVPTSMTDHLTTLKKKKVLQKVIKEFQLTEATVHGDRISFKRNDWWERQRVKIISYLSEETMRHSMKA